MFNVAHNDKSKTILQNPCPNSQALTKAQDEAAASTDAAAAADNSIPLTQQTQDSLTLICGSGGDGGVHDVIHHLQQKHGSTHRDTQQKQRAAQSMPSLQQPNRKRPRTDNRINASIPCTTSPNKNCQHDSRVVRTVGNDPNFLASFFANSRLSFIGGYQQRLVAQQQQHQPIDKQTTIHNHNTQQQEHQQRWVMHVDMDCFFCAVALRNMPASYQNKPVAISHQGKNNNKNSDNPHHRRNNDNNTNSTSECATCNYHARACGVTKGMYLGRAKQLCPDLIVLPYDFEGIAEVANQVATILQEWALKHDGLVQIVSCDEAFVQVHVPITCNDGLQDESTTLQHWATHIRHKIFSATQCTATVGVGPNKLIAKLATDHVKPNQCLVVRDYERLLQSLRVRQLPGVGAHREQQLIDHGIVWVKDVWDLGHKALETLVASLGPTNGKNVYLACHGQDDRLVQPEDPLTIGAEVREKTIRCVTLRSSETCTSLVFLLYFAVQLWR
jgi:nucleotidyltransferase/DNA polymerase involved in DNA repair